MLALVLLIKAGSESMSYGITRQSDMSKKQTRQNQPEQAREPIVLGEQLAKAAAAEEKRKAKGRQEKSPLPGQKYELQDGELKLLRPRPAPLDAALAEVVHEFAKADEATRAKMRSVTSMDEFYTLLTFSRRAAVFSLRERTATCVIDGLAAIAMIEAERVDWRDILWALSLLNHAAERIGVDAGRLFHEAAQISEPKVAELIDGFTKRSPREKSLRSSWGYEEVKISGQVGLIGWGSRKYQPTRDLTAIAVEIADFVAKDKYRPESVELASDFPAVWLKSKGNSELEKVAQRVRACALISAQLRPKEHPHAEDQMFIIFLIETANEADVEALLKACQRVNPNDYALLGVAEQNLFCVVVARSVVVGVESFETSEAIRRFSFGLADILHRQICGLSPL